MLLLSLWMHDPSSSRLFDEAVEALAGLPGVGRKTAMRLALFVLHQDEAWVRQFSASVLKLKEEARFCQRCYNLSDELLCRICSNPTRKQGIVCVVEDIRDVLAIEGTHQYQGLYHVLGGRISPMDGVGPSDLNLESLLNRCQEEELKEVILALSPTMEGDTTGFYIYRKLEPMGLEVSTIARGVGFGDALEYADELTLGRSIQFRLPFAQTLRT
jgi:recombination protein RecR